MSLAMDRNFLEYISANIDEDLPRLAYADWLDENGFGKRAEFVRVQVQRARLPAWDGAQIQLKHSEDKLLREHGEEWLAEMPAIDGARWEGFRRGVVAEVSFASFEAMRNSAAACRAVAPVEAVTVHWPRQRGERELVKPIAELRELTLTGTPDWETWEWVGDSPQFATLRQLTAHGLTNGWLGTLLMSPHLAGLRSLRLPSNDFSSYDFHAFTELKSSVLEELDLSSVARELRYNDDAAIQAAALELLVAWPGLATVRALNLNGNYMNRQGLHALLRSPHAKGLKSLSLRDTRLNGGAMAEFESASNGMSLDLLDLGQNILKSGGAKLISTATCLSELKSLKLDRCEIPASAARSFGRKATFLDSLRKLDVGFNHFGNAGLEALLEREPPHLHTLVLRDNDLDDEGIRHLAASIASDSLIELDLGRNNLGAIATAALGESAHLRQLLVLNLSDILIAESAAAALAASPLGQGLAVLELDNRPTPA